GVLQTSTVLVRDPHDDGYREEEGRGARQELRRPPLRGRERGRRGENQRRGRRRAPDPRLMAREGPRFDLPAPDPETQPFWDAAREGTLLIRRCGDCGRFHFYPRPFCPVCWSSNVERVEASGRATLYTWSVLRRNDLPPFPERVPYVAAVVALDEGPRGTTNVVDCEFDVLEIGMPLEVLFQEISEDVTIPVFRPRGAERADRGAA